MAAAGEMAQCKAYIQSANSAREQMQSSLAAGWWEAVTPGARWSTTGPYESEAVVESCVLLLNVVVLLLLFGCPLLLSHYSACLHEPF